VKVERGKPGRRVQLHRAVSKLGLGSRTQAWDWIRAGLVCVDGRVVTDPLTWVDLDRQEITCAGEPQAAVTPLTLALHKPRGVVTTRRDERGRRTVYDLLPPDLPWLFPVGRLDADSEGLLILTNDSTLATRLTEPEQHVPKTYHVTVAGRPTPEALDTLRNGVELPDGKTRQALVRVLQEGAKTTTLEVVLTEGRNRQIRRMGAAVGHKVKRLVRVAIGGYQLGDLALGQYRRLTARDVSQATNHGKHGRKTAKPMDA
jgi:23S rRNA pseudouridine2605 synthase